MTELVRADEAPATDLSVQMDYARVVSSASMLPDAYRGKPADIMLAVGLGQSMGLSPAESLYRIAVIKGKPTASAELIAANVRKAGHKLRVLTDEAAKSVKAIIVRADDPEFSFEVTRDLAWAQSMGLDRNDNYRKQPLTMLQWRAITAVARLACPEALYGVSYTPDEIADTPEQRPTGGGLRAVMAERVDPSPAPAAPTAVEPATPPADSFPADEGDRAASAGEGPTPAQLRKMGALLKEVGLPEREAALAYVADVIGREVASRNELSRAEAAAVLDALTADADVAVGEVVEP
ncbi:hypothetical protein [Nocardioides sp.]|uniref:hypothetical protein n=1 Tax=Nocardioides sp. TaxID=35761 RepID=UPI003514D3CB